MFVKKNVSAVAVVPPVPNLSTKYPGEFGATLI
jgi:hypothetical protein